MSAFIIRKRFVFIENLRRVRGAIKTDEIQHARALALQAAYARSEAATTRDDAPSAKQIRSLGLLGKDDESKQLLGRN